MHSGTLKSFVPIRHAPINQMSLDNDSLIKIDFLLNFCILHCILICRSTNEDGRSSGFLSWDNFYPGTYKMFFNTGAYFAKTNTQSFYPFVEVT